MSFIMKNLLAWARVTGGTGAAVAARNCTTARNGAGDYSVTLGTNAGVDANEGQIVVTCRTSDRYAVVVDTSDTVKQVLTFNNAGAATDSDFTIEVSQVAAGAT